MTQALFTHYYNQACKGLSWGWQQAKQYAQCEPSTNEPTLGGVALTGRAKALGIEQATMINRHKQFLRINNVACSVFGVYEYHNSLWNQSILWTLLSFPLAFGIHKAAAYAIEQYFRPKEDALYRDIQALVPKQN